MATLGKFKGIDTVSPIESLDPDWLREAINVDLLRDGKLSRRQGFTLVCPDIQHSLWSDGSTCLGVGNGQLRQLNDNYSTTALLAVADLPMVFAACDNGNIHFSNNRLHGVYDGTTARILERAGTYDRSSYQIDQAEEAVYYDGPPPGYLLEWAFGRLWVVDVDGVWHSQGFEPEKFDRENDYIAWTNVTMFKAVPSGFFIGTTKAVHFLPGGNPKGWVAGIRKVSDSGAILGTALVCDSDSFELQGISGQVCVWESNKGGKMLGTESGQAITLNKKAVYPVSDKGAMILRETNGQNHLVSTFPQGGESGNFRAADYAVAEVRRNGIII